MKFSTGAIAVLLGRPTGCIFAMDTEPTSNQLTFNSDIGSSVSIRRFNDDRAQAFRLIGRTTSSVFTYAFRSDGRLTSFRFTVEEAAMDDRYRVNYNAQTGDILGFKPTEIGMPTPQDLPAPFACDDCEMVRDDVCAFIENFCSDPPGSDLLTNSIIRATLFFLCDAINGILCVEASAEDVCSETCVTIPVP